MDNELSQPTIAVPEVPANFERKAGKTKSDFARAILELVSQSKVKGVESQLDVAALQSQVALLLSQISDLTTRVEALESP